eukprot:scaffold7153_cov115-Isochrysis_galbana.AAC.2
MVAGALAAALGSGRARKRASLHACTCLHAGLRPRWPARAPAARLRGERGLRRSGLPGPTAVARGAAGQPRGHRPVPRVRGQSRWLPFQYGILARRRRRPRRRGGQDRERLTRGRADAAVAGGRDADGDGDARRRTLHLGSRAACVYRRGAGVLGGPVGQRCARRASRARCACACASLPHGTRPMRAGSPTRIRLGAGFPPRGRGAYWVSAPPAAPARRRALVAPRLFGRPAGRRPLLCGRERRLTAHPQRRRAGAGAVGSRLAARQPGGGAHHGRPRLGRCSGLRGRRTGARRACCGRQPHAHLFTAARSDLFTAARCCRRAAAGPPRRGGCSAGAPAHCRPDAPARRGHRRCDPRLAWGVCIRAPRASAPPTCDPTAPSHRRLVRHRPSASGAAGARESELQRRRRRIHSGAARLTFTARAVLSGGGAARGAGKCDAQNQWGDGPGGMNGPGSRPAGGVSDNAVGPRCLCDRQMSLARAPAIILAHLGSENRHTVDVVVRSGGWTAECSSDRRRDASGRMFGAVRGTLSGRLGVRDLEMSSSSIGVTCYMLHQHRNIATYTWRLATCACECSRVRAWMGVCAPHFPPHGGDGVFPLMACNVVSFYLRVLRDCMRARSALRYSARAPGRAFATLSLVEAQQAYSHAGQPHMGVPSAIQYIGWVSN